MILEQSNNSSSSRVFDKSPEVVILDPGGKLKLARWRLQSDGLHVYYIKDVGSVEPFLQREEIKIVILNVDAEEDLELLEKIRKPGTGFKIIAVLGDKASELRKRLSLLGVNATIDRPIDYPRLSDIVKRQRIDAGKEARQKKGWLRRAVGVPLSILKACFAYRAVLDQIKIGIMVLDSGGRLKYVNLPLISLLGFREEDVSDKHYREVWSVLSEPQLSSILHLLDNTYAGHRVPHATEIIVDNVEGPISCRAEAHPVFGRNGEFAGCFMIFEDLSNPKRLEQAMVQSEKLAIMSQLAAGAAHEIRNPLTSVRGFIQLLQNELMGTPKMDYINIIIKEIDRVNNIVNEFLKLAKPAPPNRKPADIRDVFEQIRLLTESEAFLKNISLKKEFSGILPPIMIDEEQIKQVIINIVRNSFEAMDNGGTLTARAYEVINDRVVCLELSDTGSGMDEETLKKIFDPFYTTKEHGTGLGLAVSSEIMKSHGGRIEAKSEVGRGTTVYLYFPY